jgi:hypothetical protein
MPCRVFRVGVFFDGTGNSKEEKATYSNVAKLHELYEVRNEDAFVSDKIYITGLGTAKVNDGGYMQVANEDGSTDYYGGHKDEGVASLAAGDGGAKRVYDTIDRVCELLDAHPKGERKKQFRTREIDLFGFSRGAAEARDFVNTFYWEKVKEFKNYSDVRFNFIGIFDTVGSFGIAGNDIDMKPRREYADEVGEGDGFTSGAVANTLWGSDDLDHQDDKKYEPFNFHLGGAQAHTIIHLTAKNELRHNFPLFDARGAAREYSCVGVHSDIGGGYGSGEEEQLFVRVRYSDTQKKEIFEQNGWTPVVEKEIGFFSATPTHVTYAKKRTVGNALQDVYLHVMHQLALQAKVPLKELSTPINPALGTYGTDALQNPASLHSHPQAENIRVAFAHQSATFPSQTILPYPLRWPKNTAEGANANVVNIKDRRIQREVYHNNTSKAVQPV